MFKTICALSAISGAEAYHRSRDEHPFTGEHADKNVILHGDGSFTGRAEAHRGHINKYDDLISKREYKHPVSGYTLAYNTMFGPTPQQQEFEDALKAEQPRRHRLRAKQTFKYEDDYTQFLGTFYMKGGSGQSQWEGKAFLDTTTDLSFILGYC